MKKKLTLVLRSLARTMGHAMQTDFPILAVVAQDSQGLLAPNELTSVPSILVHMAFVVVLEQVINASVSQVCTALSHVVF